MKDEASQLQVGLYVYLDDPEELIGKVVVDEDDPENLIFKTVPTGDKSPGVDDVRESIILQVSSLIKEKAVGMVFTDPNTWQNLADLVRGNLIVESVDESGVEPTTQRRSLILKGAIYKLRAYWV